MDINLLWALSKCRVIELKDAEQYFEVTMRELDEWVDEGLLFREEIKDHLKLYQYYYPTPIGERHIRQLTHASHSFYHGTRVIHDAELMKFYLRRQSSEQVSWVTKNDLLAKYRIPGVIDGAFLNMEKEWEGIKVLSQLASRSEVEEAESFLKEAKIVKMNYVLY